ncbi:MAG: 1,4-alpha-glucan branching protein GlgB [Gemmatimonadaceae bacterium]|nr:1,4-alpha-glucan branching protein GlgB [Gemmatimonadaceae bacterium]
MPPRKRADAGGLPPTPSQDPAAAAPAQKGDAAAKPKAKAAAKPKAKAAAKPKAKAAAKPKAKAAAKPKVKAAAKPKAKAAVEPTATVVASETAAPAATTPSAAVVHALVHGHHANPFSVLGLHADGDGFVIRALVPGAERVVAKTRDGELIAALDRLHDGGLFQGACPARVAYELHAERDGAHWVIDDPYAYGPVLGPMDDWLIGEGTHVNLYDRLGAHLIEHEGRRGVHFAVWAPNATRVSVVGSFNDWDGRRHVMRCRLGPGVWEIFIPGLTAGVLYKYEILGPKGELLPLKADPLGFASELRPATASIVCETRHFTWTDDVWMAQRLEREKRRAPLSVYEVHLGSWRRGPEGRWLTYDEIADALIPYLVEQGFTHVELMPVHEHPYDASWGYQPVGLFAPTSRFGTPEQFARFVDRCHGAGIGVIIDWVPAHFPMDAHGLARFDGTALYEHADPRLGFHPDWNTAIYNFGRNEVANFLIANALFWLDRYHIDGLRVDAVASMLYLNYSRKDGEWIPNRHGGNENLEAVAFLRRMNEAVYGRFPGAFTVAEESTAWPAVSRPTSMGGLGFGFKWNMGWMHDTLKYMGENPVHRRWHHDKMTFGLVYAFTENFFLPLSHDEVVHGKGSILARKPGDDWQRFANLRAYYAFMWGYPGKKLLFMGQEFGQGAEWNFNRDLDWWLLDGALHKGVQSLVRDANRAYVQYPALHQRDCEPEGFRWIVVDDAANSVFAWVRYGEPGTRCVVVIANFTPVPRTAYPVGLPFAGRWREILNSDAAVYGGSNVGNAGGVDASGPAAHGFDQSALITLPPLATVWLVHES